LLAIDYTFLALPFWRRHIFGKQQLHLPEGFPVTIMTQRLLFDMGFFTLLFAPHTAKLMIVGVVAWMDRNCSLSGLLG
jgi:hypothetical protein